MAILASANSSISSSSSSESSSPPSASAVPLCKRIEGGGGRYDLHEYGCEEVDYGTEDPEKDEVSDRNKLGVGRGSGEVGNRGEGGEEKG